MSVRLEITERLQEPAEPQATLTLPFELRQKSRLLVKLDSGEPVGLFMPRGTILRQGDLLRTNTELIIRIDAAPEAVSTATTDDPWLLARACYHLGNRHIPLQIGPSWLRYLQDHVLDDLVRELGLTVVRERTPFEPEAGAYGAGHDH